MHPGPVDHRGDGTSRAILLANGAGAAAAAVFAAVGLVNPGYVDTADRPGPLTRFWAASSAVRTWSITAPLLVAVATRARPSPHLLATAGLVQLGDSALGIWQRNPRMALAPAIMGAVHLASSRAALRRRL